MRRKTEVSGIPAETQRTTAVGEKQKLSVCPVVNHVVQRAAEAVLVALRAEKNGKRQGFLLGWFQRFATRHPIERIGRSEDFRAMAHDVFISYASEDKVVAEAACDALEAAGIRCWIAPRNIVPGTDWPVAITQSIADCRLVVLIFSSHSNESKDVGRELKCAEDGVKVIVPFRIADVRPTSMLQYYMSATHWLDALTPPLESHLHTLCDTVRSYCGTLGNEPASQPAVAAPPIADRRTKPTIGVAGVRPFRMAIFGGLAVVTAVLYWFFASKWAMVALPRAQSGPTEQLPITKHAAVKIKRPKATAKTMQTTKACGFKWWRTGNAT